MNKSSKSTKKFGILGLLIAITIMQESCKRRSHSSVKVDNDSRLILTLENLKQFLLNPVPMISSAAEFFNKLKSDPQLLKRYNALVENDGRSTFHR